MGTDIFLYAEWRHNEKWQFIGEMIEDTYYGSDPEHKKTYHPKDLYDIRNYGLFAILADVRNDEGFECIAPRRGIPDDFSPEIKSFFESFHSNESDTTWLPQDEKRRASWIAYDNDMQLCPGWLTLEELVNFDWHGKRIQRYGWVDEQVVHLFHPERSFPFREWPQGIRVVTLGHKENCNVSWTETYAEAAGSDFMELLDTFSHKYGVSKDIRFVFWFA